MFLANVVYTEGQDFVFVSIQGLQLRSFAVSVLQGLFKKINLPLLAQKSKGHQLHAFYTI